MWLLAFLNIVKHYHTPSNMQHNATQNLLISTAMHCSNTHEMTEPNTSATYIHEISRIFFKSAVNFEKKNCDIFSFSTENCAGQT